MEEGKEFYIGLESEEERKQAFLLYFGVNNKMLTWRGTLKTTPESPLHFIRAASQDPYDEDSWLSHRQLNNIQLSATDLGEAMHNLFNQRYTVTKDIALRSDSATQPDLYHIESKSDYYRNILYQRSDLFMKAVPLIQDARACNPRDADSVANGDCDYKDNDDLGEIYNEIIIAYFLNELRYGYTQVLSLHFMTIVDWFVALRQSVNDSVPEEPFFYQMIVSERLDTSVFDYLELLKPRVQPHQITSTVRAILFQVLHALETAWHTNRYTHNDLHLKNVMLQRIPPESPLYGRDFLYRRLDSPEWCRVPSVDLDNYIVKIIDFGRNRLFVPSTPGHINVDGERRHVHDRLICTKGWDHVGYPCDQPNRFIDVRLLLRGLYTKDMPDEVRNMVARLIDPDDTPYKLTRQGTTARDALNDPFFDEYRTASLVPTEPLSQEEILDVRDSHVVVSFLANPAEADMLTLSCGGGGGSTATKEHHCAVCRHKCGTRMLRVGETETLCGRACYEFKYLFGEKTVYR